MRYRVSYTVAFDCEIDAKNVTELKKTLDTLIVPEGKLSTYRKNSFNLENVETSSGEHVAIRKRGVKK